jgi:hypothetical protein
MKVLILSYFLICTLAVQAQEKKQSLKDLLYSGKLKKDSSGVIRSTDDLSSKIDTSTKKPVEAEKPKPVNPPDEAAKPAFIPRKDTANVTVASLDTSNAVVDISKPEAAPVTAVPAKTNTKLWKEYIDAMVKTLNAEALKSKQIKKDTYYVSIDYEIGTDGMVTVAGVNSTPANAFLQSQVKQYLDTNPLQLNPTLDGSNQPKKVKRKQNFGITKE